MTEQNISNPLVDITISRTTDGVDFAEVAELLASVEIGDFPADKRQAVFTGSDLVIFVYDDSRLIGTGRALSDGAVEGALYDVAVAKDWQGRGLGRLIVETLLADMPGQNVIFFANPGKEDFYEKLGCTKMKTGMARFARPERMRARGFID